MCDPTGVHITRIYVNCARQSPSPIRSSNTVPVCTSTPIVNVGPSNPSPKKRMALLAKEVLASHRSQETFIRQNESPPPEQQQYVFMSKETGQHIDLANGDGIGKITNPNPGTITKKKKKRQTLAVVPPVSTRSSKSSEDGDYLVPMTNEIQLSDEKRKANFTSYDGLQMFTFTLDDD